MTDTPTPIPPAVFDQNSLSCPLAVGLHYTAQVRATGENLRRRIITPTVTFTFQATAGKPITMRMSLEVLRRLITAAQPFVR